MPKGIKVVAHDPAWKGEFGAEAERISRALGDVATTLDHIGSTAIPGIFAKPVIDILLQVDDLARLDEKNPAMEELGYEAMGEFGIPGRRYFRKDDAAGVRTHHVHAFRTGQREAQRHLAFRDYMIAHPEEAQRYSELKQKLAREHPEDIEAYMDGKDPYIKEQEARAVAWRASHEADSK